MTEELLPAVVIEPEGTVDSAVIWLHGLGADGHDFEPIVPELRRRRTRFVFPHAPMRPVTINGGMVMRAWYDIKSMDLERHVEAADLDASRAQLESWIAHEGERGIASERIVVAGFSQGGAIALDTALVHEAPLAGVLALSCYHPRVAAVEEASRPLPIFMGHGTQDPVVPLALAEATVAALREKGYEPEWHTYPMPHSVSPQEVADIASWLEARLS